MADRFDDRQWRSRLPSRDWEDEDWYNEPRSYANRFNRGFSRQGLDREPYDRNEDREWGENPRFHPGAYDRDFDRDFECGFQNRSYPYWVDRDSEFWTTPGPYSGIGPRGYQRSDDRILEDVCERLSQHGRIDAREIEIDVNNGEVVLRGIVASRQAKHIAEDIAESISGVKDVHNQLRVSDQSRLSSPQLGSAMRSQVRAGMEVVGLNGEPIGQVKEVRSSDFLLERSQAQDFYVPLHAIARTGEKIHLNIPAGEVDNQGWEQPLVIQTPEIPKS